MRWVAFGILAIVMLTLQTALAPRAELMGVRPDWLIATVVFFALHARVVDGMIGAWAIGACADLMSIERLGLMALSYGLASLLVSAIRDELFRDSAPTRFMMTLGITFVLQIVWALYRGVLYPSGYTGLPGLSMGAVWAALYTACWALPIHAVLSRFAGAFGISNARSRPGRGRR